MAKKKKSRRMLPDKKFIKKAERLLKDPNTEYTPLDKVIKDIESQPKKSKPRSKIR